MSAAAVLFLLFYSVIKLVQIPPVVEAFTRLGMPVDLARSIATREFACLALYLVPRLAVPGAILLRGFLGGAVLTHVRVGDPLLSHVLFPVYIGSLLVIGGYAVYDVKSKEEALKWTTRFMELHRQHWKGWEGETEVCQILGAGDFTPGK